MRPTSLPGQPLPQHLQPTAPTATQATGDLVVGTGSPEGLARQFQASPVAWNAHLPAAATTTTTTTTTHIATTTTTTTSTVTTTARADASNSSQGAPSYPTGSAPAQVVPPWLQNVPAGGIRGDECFRVRYGNGISLLDDEGRINTGFTRDTTRCHARLRAHAERLAAIMKVRNDSGVSVQTAQRALQEAAKTLQDEQEKYDLARLAAQRMNIPFDDPSLMQHETQVAHASRSLDGAQRELDALTKALGQTQQVLRDLHAEAEKEVSQSDDALQKTQDEEVRIAMAYASDLARARGGAAGPFSVDPRMAVYATFATLCGAAAVVANARHVHVSALLEALDLTTHAGRLMESVLHHVSVDAGSWGVLATDNVPVMAALSHGTRDLVVGIFLGIFLAHLLIQSGRLDL